MTETMTPEQYRALGKNADKKTLWLQAWSWDQPKGLHRIEWLPEHRFAPPRRWRFDWAVPAIKVAVEVDGGQWAHLGGRHARDTDREKMNRATANGWRVFRFSVQQLQTDPAGCVAIVCEVVTK